LLYIFVQEVLYLFVDFLTKTIKSYEIGRWIDIKLFNSLWLLLIIMSISFTISIDEEIYLLEYARKNWATNEAGITFEICLLFLSVMIELFGFLVFIKQMGYIYFIISGDITLIIFNLDIIIRNVKESLSPLHFKQRKTKFSLSLSHWKIVL
jgi:ABC-type phosphate transport system permease subunit